MSFTRTIHGTRITTRTDKPLWAPDATFPHKARLYLAWWTRRLGRIIEP